MLHAATVPPMEQLADRLAILNLLGIYGAYANDGDLDGWAGLFADDAIFEIALPEAVYPVDKVTLVTGEDHIFSVYRDRLADPSSGERRLFVFSNPHIRTLESTSAEVSVTMMLVRTTPRGLAPHIEATGTYRGMLVKRAGIWLIHRWRVQTDRMPEPLLDKAAHPDAAWEP